MEADDSYFSQNIILHKKKHNAPALEMEQDTRCIWQDIFMARYIQTKTGHFLSQLCLFVACGINCN
jgi:hypothetical protein